MLPKEVEKTKSFIRYLHGCICSPCMQTRGYRPGHDRRLLNDEEKSKPHYENLLACPYESAIFDCPDIQDYLAKRPV